MGSERMAPPGSVAGRPVAIIGLGPVGLSWAALFLARGFAVSAFDVQESARAAAKTKVQGLLDALAHADALHESVSHVISRLTLASTLQGAVDGASWVQESIVERLDVKTALFQAIGKAAAPDTIMASSTSELPGSMFMQDMEGKERALVAHPINPPHIIPLVELCPTPFTAPEIVHQARQFMSDLGQSPIVLNRELVGYVANRLQVSLLGEAMRLVGEGWCSSADVDRAVRDGIGLRWAAVGPFETAHLNSPGGAAEYFAKYQPATRRIMASVDPDFDYDDDFLKRLEVDIRGRQIGSVSEGQCARDMRLTQLRAARGD